MSTAGSSTPVSAFDLDLPILEQFGDRQDLQDERRAVAEVGWLARNEFGFTVLHYDDVVAVLRDKRWHSATSRIMEMQGVTDPKYLARRRTIDPVGRGRRAHSAATPRRQGVLATGRRPLAAVHGAR